MFFDAIISKNNPSATSFAAIIARGIICIIALIFFFANADSKQMKKK